MKKLFFAGALALMGAVNAQQGKGNFKVGAHLGFPVGDLAETHGFNIGVDAAFVYPIAENFKLGVTSGYSNYVGKSEGGDKVPSLGIIPVAATAQATVGSNVFVGADLGYAFFTGDYAKLKTGGFYYQPKVGYTFTNKHDVFVSYKGIVIKGDDESLNGGAINVGYAYNF